MLTSSTPISRVSAMSLMSMPFDTNLATIRAWWPLAPATSTGSGPQTLSAVEQGATESAGSVEKRWKAPEPRSLASEAYVSVRLWCDRRNLPAGGPELGGAGFTGAEASPELLFNNTWYNAFSCRRKISRSRFNSIKHRVSIANISDKRRSSKFKFVCTPNI
eukprot:CAMPEP_0115385344 /NCGR_PEP_ID=MMETSP0271-20121206/7581_1 /TAXON_ID=71861 /ORGANISM="Scrippsiella trochoidea, Strain CCMP3099" /LENGTH=161 /DNA_ID=CAMNT_0002808739 /DNA_START=153 /DNA_END=638 /DNA_ORIENTATION=+